MEKEKLINLNSAEDYMKELTKTQLEKILKKRGLDPKVGWFYIQFNRKFNEEYVIHDISLKDSVKNLLAFLDNKKIKEVIFFPEPSFDFDIPSGIIKIEKLEDFLRKNVNTITNTHITDKDLNWIFTITHEEDFFISGSKKLVKEFISFFKKAKCTSFEKIKAKWAKKKSRID